MAPAAAGIALAAQHPLAPGTALAAVIAWTAAVARWPRLWWSVLPALLPVLSFSPWTGALIFDEFDLLLLATLGGGWLRLASEVPQTGNATNRHRALDGLLLLAGVSVVAGVARGLLDAGGPWFGAGQGYADPLNSVRVAKGLAFALLLAPLVRRGLETDPAGVLRRLCLGFWIGMAAVSAAVFAERLAFPGFFDFSQRYRTTALFWEMHVGGAAIDVYAALGAPFVAWAVWSARSLAGRLASGVLTLAWGYVCLTTFSRGVWLAVLVSLVLLAGFVWLARLRRDLRWRRVGDALLILALLAEVVGVAAAGSFMGERLKARDRDVSSRLAHWRGGVQLLHSPVDWLVGLGSGRLPPRYAAELPRREFSGQVRAVVGAPGEYPAYATLSGPRSQASLGGLYALTQRVPLVGGAYYQAGFAVRARTDTALTVLVCEMHLLYARNCQAAAVRVRGSPTGAWQHVRLGLRGPPLDPGRWFAPRAGMLLLSVENAAGAVDLSEISLRADSGPSLTRNPRFADGLAGWFPLAQRYFLPWHIDNFVLETLIERGLIGLAVSGLLIGLSVTMALRQRAGGNALPPFIAAAIVAVLLVGSVSSVQDAPRVAFAFWLLVVVALQLRVAKLSTTGPAPSFDGVFDAVPTAFAQDPTDIVPRPRNLPIGDPS